MGAIWLKFSTQNTWKMNPREIPEDYFQIEPQVFSLKSCFFSGGSSERPFREIILFAESNWELGEKEDIVQLSQRYREVPYSAFVTERKKKMMTCCEIPLPWGQGREITVIPGGKKKT